ncbi:GNAT family N-acetyltransferase [Streptomyces anulatus]|uniref:GNAT family N-acetyltransferase n=1 Tax=Streptomyces anulatus TaxID=1892 RepID=UPI00364B0458
MTTDTSAADLPPVVRGGRPQDEDRHHAPFPCAVRIAARGDGAAVGRLADQALEHTEESVQPKVRPGKNLIAHIETRGGVVRTRHGHTICRVAADQQDQVIGMIHVCPPLSWIDDHPMVMRPALGQTVTELGMLAVDPDHRGRGIGGSLLAAVEEDERARGVEVLFTKVAWNNWSSLRWYRRRGFTVAAPGETFLIYTACGETGLIDLNDGHALAYKPMQPGVSIQKHSPAGTSFLYLSSLPADSKNRRLLINQPL